LEKLPEAFMLGFEPVIEPLGNPLNIKCGARVRCDIDEG
jgi:hypothetical protein